MKKVRLWSVGEDENGELAAHDVASVDNTKTERMFERLLVRSPELLMEGLTLIGRQVMTDGGPLDLLGVDQDGRLVVFDLKRGSLTRQAVAQVLDYASDIGRMDPDGFAKLIEGTSGRGGVEKIEDFADWYSQRFSDLEGVLEEPPRMVLVGLGTDPHTLRIVDFLAEAGIDISLLTFHAFEQDDCVFLARQVESHAPKPPPSGQTKAGNLRALQANAAECEVSDFIEEVAGFVEQKTPARKWPGKTQYAFGLMKQTDEGSAHDVVYVNVALNRHRKGSLDILFRPRAVRAAGEALSTFHNEFSELCSKGQDESLTVTVPKDRWANVRTDLEGVLQAMVRGWREKTSGQQTASNEPGGRADAPSPSAET